jgi:SpoIIAA-like
MLETIESPENVVALKVVGKLHKDDYDSVLLPALRRMIDGPGEVRLVLVLAEEFEGLTVGGTTADAGLYVNELFHGELSKWKRCAVVTDRDWLRNSIAMFRWMMPGAVEVFEPSRLEQAIAWTAA